MPKFSQSSINQLLTCHDDLRILCEKVIESFDCVVICGHRNKADQEAAFAKGTTQKHYPNGNHNFSPSNAVDIYPYPLNYDDTKQMIYFAGFVMATAIRLYEEGKISHRIRWGGDWDSDKKNIGVGLQDYGHFELIPKE